MYIQQQYNRGWCQEHNLTPFLSLAEQDLNQWTETSPVIAIDTEMIPGDRYGRQQYMHCGNFKSYWIISIYDFVYQSYDSLASGTLLALIWTIKHCPATITKQCEQTLFEKTVSNTSPIYLIYAHGFAILWFVWVLVLCMHSINPYIVLVGYVAVFSASALVTIRL